MAPRRLGAVGQAQRQRKANGDYDKNERRYLYRLMLKGEAPI
jgi:hypothetical protein